MIDKNFSFIKGCEAEKKLSPEWIEAFEDVMPKWLEIHVSAYNACKKRGVPFFEIANYIDFRQEIERFDEGGFSYILWEDSRSIPVMTFDHEGSGFGTFWWEDLIRCEYPHLYDHYTPNYLRTSVEMGDFGHYRSYFTRVCNRREPFNFIANKVRDYFRMLTGDPDVLFSLGDQSYIALDDAGKRYGELMMPY